MACARITTTRCFTLFLMLHISTTESVHWSKGDNTVHPLPVFSHYSTFKPQFYHGHEKREILSTNDDVEGGHIHDLIISYNVDNKSYILDLQLNRDLIADSYFEKHQRSGQNIVNKPSRKEVELCHYHGKVRGVENSWVAVSTCSGLSGMLFDGKEVHYVEPGSSVGHREEDSIGTHFLYKHSNLITNQTCGYPGTPQHISRNQNLRNKREAKIIRGPYNANKTSRYVELVLVIDNKQYKKLDSNLSAVSQYSKNIVNIVNAIYTPLNIFVTLVGLVVWTEGDEIDLPSNDGDTALANFLRYRREKLVKEHPNDHAHLITGVNFENGVIGKSLKGPICTYEYSGGITVDIGEVGYPAVSVAHQLGHNFGMEHDTTECKCSSGDCIMSKRVVYSTEWSSCSLEYLLLAFEHGMDSCLRNKPTSLFNGPVCGNGFLEADEDCDCGLKDYCDNLCCDASTCMLQSNASCATGECCDLQTCQMKASGNECRSADHECDLPEYCTGQSEFCPNDVYKMDGEDCGQGKAFCYQGSCHTHSDQCHLLWGSSGKNSSNKCYEQNTKGNRFGNCGYDRLSHTYLQCAEEDIFCGRLHCKHMNEKLEFGMEAVSILSHAFISSNGTILPCRVAIIDLGLSVIDPGLVPNGAKCGLQKMCLNQHCVDVDSLREEDWMCPQNCSGNGVCNSRGHCHCKPGFAPPLCDKPGTGGSEDSGPTTYSSNEKSDKINNLLEDQWRTAVQEFRSDIEAALKKLLDKMEHQLLATFSSNTTFQDN